jgi:ABC-type lipoprotein release transport system permease subunit
MQKKGRLALTGFTLMLAIAAFMGVTSVFRGLSDTLDSAFETFNFEISLITQQAQNFDETRALILENVEGVEDVYPAYGVSVALDGFESKDPLTLGSNQLPATGIDPASPVIQFDLEAGDGWENDPARRGVILTHVLAEILGKEAGDTIIITVAGVSHEYEILGIDRYPFEVIFFDWQELAQIAGFVGESGQQLTDNFFIDLAGEPSIEAVDEVITSVEVLMLANGVQATYANHPGL